MAMFIHFFLPLCTTAVVCTKVSKLLTEIPSEMQVATPQAASLLKQLRRKMAIMPMHIYRDHMAFWSLDQKVGVEWMAGWMDALYTSLTTRAPVVLSKRLNIQTLPRKLIRLPCARTNFLPF